MPKSDDPSLRPRHPQYQAIVARVVKPAWVIDREFESGNLDAWAFSQAGYTSEQIGVFTIYWAGEASRGVGTP